MKISANFGHAVMRPMAVFSIQPEGTQMFNRSMLAAVDARHTTHNHTTVQLVDPSVEKGARFLNEIEEKAADRIVQTMLVGTDGFKARFVLFEQARNIASMSTETFVAFEVNGQRYQERITTPKPWGVNAHEAQREVLHHIATALTAQLMTDLCENHFWEALR